MSEINWERHKAAAYATVNFFDESDRSVGFKRLYRPATQTKTVADAYEALGGEWGSEFNFLYWHTFRGWVYASGGDSDGDYKIVCTREQFEDYVEVDKVITQAIRENISKPAQSDFTKEQEGEKWTHIYGEHGCYIKVSEPDFNGCVVVVNDLEEYQLIEPEELKPIKPKLTKAEAWDKLMERQTNSAEVNTLKQQYDII